MTTGLIGAKAWALFPGSVAYIWHAGTKAGIVQDKLSRPAGFETRSQIIWGQKQTSRSAAAITTASTSRAGTLVRKGSTASWVGDHCQTTFVADRQKFEIGNRPRHAKSRSSACRRPIEELMRRPGRPVPYRAVQRLWHDDNRG